MSTTPAAVTHQWFDQVWNIGSEAAIDRLMAAGAQVHGLPTPDRQPVVGPVEFKPFWRKFRSALPDIKISTVRTLMEDEYVAVHCRITGTHQGLGLNTPPTNKVIQFEGMVLVHVKDGQIAEAWNFFDFLSLYEQIGLLAHLHSTGLSANQSTAPWQHRKSSTS